MWWQQPGLLESWLDDFLGDALQKRGLGELLTEGDTRVADLLAKPQHFGFASLDMVELASRFAHTLGIDRTGLSDLLLARRSAEGWLSVARRSLAIDHSTLCFYSSGSTGNPKPAAHPLAKLQREVEAFAAILPPVTRVITTAPAHHIYGFIWGALLPSVLGCERLRVHPERSLPTSWTAQLANGDLIVATPEVWAMLLARHVRLPDSFTGISSTAPLPAATAAAIQQQYPGAVLLEVYGSSETAGLAWRQQHDRPFTLLPFWTMQHQHDQWQVQDRDDGQQYPLSDQLQQHDAEHISVLGRVDAVVQINGNNINLAQLEAKLRTHADVADALVRSDTDGAQTGLHYFIVLKQPPDDLKNWCQSYSDWLTANLGNTPPPRAVVVAPSLPVNPLGKRTGWTVSHYQPVTGNFRSGFAQP